ncbi:PAS domain-containing sensor histidine kinase [Gimesia algae]|uniref:histidine kinase n=1 Tax=Gimesia algae TaxID=2527971 RepID=A0A517VGE3_9PLAN|nr:ATP-binding protein [Gimesia algae]QDT92074.1 Sensor protein FixL [Gimesia algae]
MDTPTDQQISQTSTHFDSSPAAHSETHKGRKQEPFKHGQSEKQLRRSSQHTQNILDSLFVFVGIFSNEGILLEIKHPPLERDHLNTSEMIGKPFWDTDWWSHSSEALQTLKQALLRSAQGEVIRFDTKVRLSKTRMMDLDFTFEPLYDDEGQLCQIIGSAVDITDRMLAEKTVIRKRAQVEALLQVNPDLLFHMSIDGTIVGVESGKLKNFLLPTDTLHQMQMRELFPEAVVSQFELAIDQVIQTQNAAAFEYTLQSELRTHWFQVRLLPYLPEEVLVVIQDISRLKESKIEVNRVHTRLYEAQRLAHFGSWEWDPQNNNLWWSEEVFRILDLTETELQPDYHSFLQIIHEEDRELVSRVIINTLKNNLPFSIEHRIIRPNGEIRYVHQQAALKMLPEHTTPLMYGTIQDITKKYATHRMAHEYRDELAHVSRLSVMGELAAGLSHELNQPLTAIANYSAAIKNLLERGEDASEVIDKVIEQSLRSGEIVQRLRSLVKKRKQQRALFNIHFSIRSAIQLISYQIRLKQIQVQTWNENNFTMVYADQIQIEQVLINLFKNAVEAMADSDSPRILTISTAAGQNNMIHISVKDTGLGISADLARRLFTPFTTTKKEGIGIGLSLSHSLVAASGGKMWHTPNPEGGAIFHLLLPAFQPQQDHADSNSCGGISF